MNKNIAIIAAISPNFQGLQYNWTNWYNHRCFNTLSRILDCWKLLTSRIFFPFTAAVFSRCWLVILSLVPSSKNKMYEILWMTQPLQNLILFHPQKKLPGFLLHYVCVHCSDIAELHCTLWALNRREWAKLRLKSNTVWEDWSLTRLQMILTATDC